MAFKTEEEIRAFHNGMREACYLWAWWKNGIQYVGCGAMTYRQAMDEIATKEKNMKEALGGEAG